MNPDDIPQRLRTLPIHRGLPVPFFVHWKEDGTPDPRICSIKAIRTCAKRRVCWVCGQFLLDVTTFIGGPLSLAHETFSDGPMHPECSTFALQVCPYLAVPRRDRTADPSQSVYSPFGSGEKPERFVQVFAKGYRTSPDPKTEFLFHPVGFIKDVWWKEGIIV